MRLCAVWSREELTGLQFPIIVERWDKKNDGRAKREYLKEFDEAERAKLGRLYRLFYSWYLVKGTPDEHSFAPNTVDLINRAVAFFASI
jgi:hypothetical protein